MNKFILPVSCTTVGDTTTTLVSPTEVVAPPSKLKNLMTGGRATSVNITLSGELKAKRPRPCLRPQQGEL
jgi:hypothetical protein